MDRDLRPDHQRLVERLARLTREKVAPRGTTPPLRFPKKTSMTSFTRALKAKEELESQMDRCLSGEFTNPSNLRLAQHLIRHQDQCFCSWNGRMWRQLTGGPNKGFVQRWSTARCPRGIGRPRARRPKRS